MKNETYFKMCKEAHELQDTWKPKVGDRAKYMGYEVLYLSENHMEHYNFETLIWLPYQEDLQEIYKTLKGLSLDCCYLKFKKWNAFHYNNKYYDHYGNIQIFSIFEPGSWNVLWLCYVMETCYHKLWNGTTWEEI